MCSNCLTITQAAVLFSLSPCLNVLLLHGFMVRIERYEPHHIKTCLTGHIIIVVADIRDRSLIMTWGVGKLVGRIC